MKILQGLARSRFGGWALRFSFAHFHRWIPVRRLGETGDLVAFNHPLPTYEHHILIVPKRSIRSIDDLDDSELETLGIEALRMAHNIRGEFHLGDSRLVLNAGNFQDTGQIHFHLIGTKSR